MKAYVYAILVDDVVRYIGKGSGDRMRHHLKIVRSIVRRRAAGEAVSTTKLYNRLAKAWRAGADIQLSVIAGHLSDREAFDREIVEIANTKGLWNEAPGGQGFSSEQWTDPLFQQKMQARDKKRVSSMQWREQHSKAVSLVWENPEFRELRDRKRWPPEKRAKQGEQEKERWGDPDFRETASKRLAGIAKAAWADPALRQKITAAQNEGKARRSPEKKKEISEKLKALWRDPVHRAKMLTRRRRKFAGS
jgi:hypothetical protein